MGEAGPTMTITRPGLRQRYPWLLPGGLLLIFVLLTVNVLANGPLIPLDRHIHAVVRQAKQSGHWKWVAHGQDTPARLLIASANFQYAIPVLVVVAIAVALRHHSLRPVFTAAVGLVLLLATVLPLQYLIGRGYPDQAAAQLAPGRLGSFPSGHAATAAVCYGLAVLLLSPGPRRLGGWVLLTCAWLLALGVGASLVYVGAHWFTDVVAGWTLAGLVIMLTVRLTRGRPVGQPDEVSTTLPHLPPALKKS
ncbi:MAG TPA: phosphatase PAP2 family protein [Streptosporangiaceae bacterium]|jgi:undecaprenyl-diphosphatase|nr:phosphatase PAP2 family protein [Streptosporangiaceae bacterium]